MKFSVTSLLSFGAMALVMASCGQNDTKSTSTSADSSTTASTMTTQATAHSTIVTTPENELAIQQKVADFNKWLAVYEGHDTARKAKGIHDYVVARGVQDSNMVLVAFKLDDVNSARAFVKDPGLKEAMKKGGVTGEPKIGFMTAVFQDTATIATPIRSRVMLTVKDWDTWHRVFDSTSQIRKDNGLMDRVVGHDIDDNHKVTVVVAVLDSAKAVAFWNSDQLKKIMDVSGVVSKPDRFLYRIVKRY
jgi:hypothetical protein